MVGRASSRIMEDGKRLHMQHGPIDIVAQAFGEPSEIAAAYQQGITHFETILDILVQDLDLLRTPVQRGINPQLQGIAGQMWQAAHLFAEDRFVTPMAAVAGAVADHVKTAMIEGRTLNKLYVNNGGDIALHLSGAETFVTGIVNNQDRPSIDAKTSLIANDGIGGLATSGWRGRSFSLGIADAVTVLADTAANADVAATLIAGDVWVDSPVIVQEKASNLDDNSDLKEMLVTIDVGDLRQDEIDVALRRGLQSAQKYQADGLIKGAYLALQGEGRSLSMTTRIKGRKVA